MIKTKIDLENCYGIKKLEYEFDFSAKSTYVVYAPNGTMKTSFAKTFSDLSKNIDSKDQVFDSRQTKREIVDEANGPIPSEGVFVIEPYNQSYKSGRMSTLLVNKTLKEKYDDIHSTINEKKEILLKEIKKQSGLKIDKIESTLSTSITTYPNEFYKSLLRVVEEVNDGTDPQFSNLNYSKIFTDKVIAFLAGPDIQSELAEYIRKYDALLESSTYFKKGVFNHNNASVIAKNLKDNGFFKAEHSVSLNTGSDRKEIATQEELEELIQVEKNTILLDPELTAAFDKIDKKLKANQELRNFRDYLLSNPVIISELINIQGFQQKIWISYLKSNLSKFQELITEYKVGKEEIEKIVVEAKKEETNWRNVINIFNERFSVPFKLRVENQEDVILNSDGPNIQFEFFDSIGSAKVNENDLLKILSNGEKRALYILNIIFEVEARKQEEQETLFVVDDIADSFDYKNKYAIIEYLKDISIDPLFNQILLTHNYDFFRTVSSRLDMEREHKLTTLKSSTDIKLIEVKYQNNPFSHWKNNLDKPSMLIASIPFVRNLFEFIGDTANESRLTSLLHIKDDSNTLKISDLQTIYREILKDKPGLVLPSPTDTIIDVIYSTTEMVMAKTAEQIELEDKIVLAIAIRLKAEEFMIDKINDQNFVNSITKNQTSTLFRKYSELFSDQIGIVKLLDQVNLMTPENIHVNSFMYEPILDMSNDNLKALFTRVKQLNVSS